MHLLIRENHTMPVLVLESEIYKQRSWPGIPSLWFILLDKAHTNQLLQSHIPVVAHTRHKHAIISVYFWTTSYHVKNSIDIWASNLKIMHDFQIVHNRNVTECKYTILNKQIMCSNWIQILFVGLQMVLNYHRASGWDLWCTWGLGSHGI